MFKHSVEDTDRRLASLVTQAYDDCAGLESVFRLIDIYGSLLERPLIKEEFAAFYEEIVQRMDDDILACKRIYDGVMAEREATGKITLHKNQAKVSGSLRWSYELKDRMNANMEAFKRIEHP